MILAFVALGAALPCFARAKEEKLPPSTRIVLENGFEAVLIPNRVAPLVTSVVVVRCGAARETPATNGISHMLEHLLFNGTARRTQEQLYDELDRYGIINNAHTGSEHTAYFVMATRDQFGRALDLQADMLFGSTFPEEKLAKERDIIINEIAKDRVGDETAMSELYDSRLYHPGGLELPVIGTPETVKGITRDAILAYYRAWYAPDNMTAVIMGDFEVEEMEPLVRRYFGAAAPALLARPVAGSVNPAALGLAHSRRTEGSARLLWLGAPAPRIGHSGEFEKAWLLAALLGEDLARAVNARLAASGAGGSLLEAGTGLDAHAQASTYQVRAALDPNVSWTEATRALLDEIGARLQAASWKTRDLDRLRLEEKAALMRLWEKPHYFGMDRAPYIAAGGWELARDLVKRLSWVEPADLKDATRALTDPKSWATFMLGPDVPQDEGAIAVAGATVPSGPTSEEDATPESRALVERWKGPRAPAGEAAPADSLAGRPDEGRPAVVNTRAILPNGLQVSVDSSDDSRIFAAHVLVKNRAAAEPPGKNGIVEMLHRLAGAGTRRHPGAALGEALAAIGGSLKVIDDPAIPYDDIYLSPEYSYIRLEALDEFAPEALGLLREILAEPILDDETAIATAREQVVARARQSRSSPRERCRLLMARSLWGDAHPFAMPLFGVESDIRSITAEDLRAFHAVYFHPRNLIVGVGTSVRTEKLLPAIESGLGRWTTTAARGPKPAGPPAGPPAGAATGAATVSEIVEAPQAYLLYGRLAPAGPASGGAYRTLAAVLSRRMGDTLREKRGLAYALGADASALGGRIQFTASMGVLPARVDEARAGLREVLAAIATSPPEPREVEDAARSTEVRMLMRNLSRINRAYARCLEEMRRTQAEPAAKRDAEPAGPVSAGQVGAAARLLIGSPGLEGWTEAVVRPPAGPSTKETPKETPK